MKHVFFLLIFLTSLKSFGQTKDSIWLDQSRRGCVGMIYTYYNRDSVITGRCTDYYPNGNIHIKGNFSWGSVRDTLQEFYSNGNLKHFEVYKEIPEDTLILITNVIWQDYYENGNLQYSRNSLLKEKRENYPSGKKKMELFEDGEIVANKFYSDGKLKIKIKNNVMNEYSENGDIMLIASYSNKPTRAEVQADIDDCTRMYSYVITNERGHKTKGRIKLNAWKYHHYFGEFPNLEELQKLVRKK